MQEFERLASVYHLSVKVIPISQHHELYCAEDIEIWEVRRMSQNEPARNGDDSVQVTSWGSELAEVGISMLGTPVTLRQIPSGLIGAVLWPSSVILSR